MSLSLVTEVTAARKLANAPLSEYFCCSLITLHPLPFTFYATRETTL